MSIDVSELFDQVHIKGELAMKELQPLRTQCFGSYHHPSPSHHQGTAS